MRKITVIFCFLFCLQAVAAQTTVVLENFRCYNLNAPVLTHLSNNSIRKNIASQLNKVLLQIHKSPLADTNNIRVEEVDFNYVVPAITPNFKDTDTSKLHLYIDFIEADPLYFFRNTQNNSPDTALQKRVQTVFTMRVAIYNAGKILISSEELNLMVSIAETPGMGTLYRGGIRFTDLAVLPKTFTELLRVGFSMVLQPGNDVESIEIKVQPAYYVDNYIAPMISNRNRSYLANNKGIYSYRLGNNPEMIRSSEPVYEEIKIKGKKAEKYPDNLTAAIKASNNFSASDYVFLRQEWRDIIRDKNYLIKLTTQINPQQIPNNTALLFTNFLFGNFHYLLQEKDTIAVFSILKDVTEKNNKVFPDLIYNGFDSTSVFKLPMPVNRSQDVWVEYSYVINGSANGMPFHIKCSGLRNTLKEFFIGDKLVCIAQGKFIPEKFVVFDASLSPELLNRLFMIGFNHFLE